MATRSASAHGDEKHALATRKALASNGAGLGLATKPRAPCRMALADAGTGQGMAARPGTPGRTAYGSKARDALQDGPANAGTGLGNKARGPLMEGSGHYRRQHKVWQPGQGPTGEGHKPASPLA